MNFLRPLIISLAFLNFSCAKTSAMYPLLEKSSSYLLKRKSSFILQRRFLTHILEIDANKTKYRNTILETPIIPKNTPKSYDLPPTFFIENRKGIMLDRVNGRIFHAHRAINMDKELCVTIDSEEEAENKQFSLFKEADEKSGSHSY